MNTISICIPILNEENHIDDLLESLINTHHKDKEIVLIDGCSTDNTVEKIRHWQSKYSNIKLIENHAVYVSHGFNKAFNMTESKYIALIGAHAVYPKNYFAKGIEILDRNESDAVGGPLIHKGKDWKGKIIANCMMSQFGVGDVEFRTSKERGYVDSVPMAIYKREIFSNIGLFDEQLVRNQDDEFHYRLNAHGYRILMEPEMASIYFVRNNLLLLWKQYFSYGYYKPLVIKKVRSCIRARHLVPASFVSYIITLPLLINYRYFFIIPLFFYIIIILILSLKYFNSLKDILYSSMCFITLHISYGLGFLLGIPRALHIK
jgi:glycosyltransferase involved in cell wall biosynthesis